MGNVARADRTHPLAEDLDHILQHTRPLWEDLRGERIFITGGTGFFGKWLLESFAWANAALDLRAEAHVLTRNREKFLSAVPHLGADPSMRFHNGDVRAFNFPEGHFAYFIHAATESSAQLNGQEPWTMYGTIVEGTRRALECAVHAGAAGFLLTSSGAVYGKQPAETLNIPESFAGGPDPLDTNSAYGEGKRSAELLCALEAKRSGLETKIARCFAFVGPYLNLDIHYAIGNFIRDGLRGGPIVVKGDGTPFRSYLYAADLMVWLWTILFRGTSCRPYNVGSAEAMTIEEVAGAVAHAFDPPVVVSILGRRKPAAAAERYIPSTQRAERELGLAQHISTSDAIRRTIAWHKARTHQPAAGIL